MRIGRNHQVTTDVGIAIENDEVVSCAVNYQIPFVVRGILLGCAEDAIGRRFFRTAGCDVFVPPGTPQYFHKQTPTMDRMDSLARSRVTFVY
jgi:hypothetical protein